MKLKLFILILLLASLYAHSENMDSADGDYCFAMDSADGDSCFAFDGDYCLAFKRTINLLLVKRNNNLTIQTADKADKSAVCGGIIGYSNGKIEFVDKSGQNITFRGAVMGGMDWHEEYHPLPSEIQIPHLPPSLSRVTTTLSIREYEDLFTDLLQRYKNKTVDGYVLVRYACKPNDLEYKIKYRARITGKCESDFIKKRERKYNGETANE